VRDDLSHGLRTSAVAIVPIAFAFVALGVPIFDTAFAIVRRVRSRAGATVRDKGHIHHLLMNLGHGQRRSVFILWAWTAILSGVVLATVYSEQGDAFVPAGVAALATGRTSLGVVLLAEILRAHGRMLLQWGRPERAEQLVFGALAVLEAEYDTRSHPNIDETKRALMQLYETVGRPDLVERYRAPAGEFVAH
jgi:hypothetical protein